MFILANFLANFVNKDFLLINTFYFFSFTALSLIFFNLSIIFKLNRKITLTTILLFAFFLGIWRFSFSLPKNLPNKIHFYNQKYITFQGIITNDPEIKNQKQKFIFKTQKLISLENNKIKNNFYLSGKVLIHTLNYPQYNYGEQLKIFCEIQKPQSFAGFAYDRYLIGKNIYSICYFPKIEKLEKDLFYYQFGKIIFSFKNKLIESINQNLNPNEAGLIKAILLGDKSDLSYDLKQKFSQVGLSHIIAVSGLHISLLIAMVMYIFLNIGFCRKQAFYLTILFLFFYLFLIGFPASAIRASLMGILVLLALNYGRNSNLINSLLFSAVFLLLLNPQLLFNDLGFQLSFSAVLGIGFVYPILNKKVENFFEKRNFTIHNSNFFKIIKDIILITLSAQFTTLAFLIFNFSQISLIAPLSNLLVFWTLPLVIILGIITLFLNLFFNLSGLFLLLLLLLKYIIFISDLMLKIPYAYLDINFIYPEIFWLIYLLMIFILYKLHFKYILD